MTNTHIKNTPHIEWSVFSMYKISYTRIKPLRISSKRFVAPQVGLEPTTLRLTAACSTNWAIEDYIFIYLIILLNFCSILLILLKIPLHSSKYYLLLWRFFCVGIFLFSQAVTSQVFSAPLSLTSVFGMVTGVPSVSSIPTFLSITLTLNSFSIIKVANSLLPI